MIEPSDSSDPALRTPFRFLANGTLVGLKLGGREVFRGVSERCGFFALKFDGTQAREIPLPRVAVLEDGGLRVIGSNGFPRLEFSVAGADDRLQVNLIRMEGMPAWRDLSLGFRFGLAAGCEVAAHGEGALITKTDHGVRIYWTDTAATPRTAGFGGFVIVA